MVDYSKYSQFPSYVIQYMKGIEASSTSSVILLSPDHTPYQSVEYGRCTDSTLSRSYPDTGEYPVNNSTWSVFRISDGMTASFE